jgi:hypothetical protein
MVTRAGAGILALLALAGCANDVPTATGTELFPAGTDMTTIDLVVPTSQFLSGDTVYDGFSSVRNASYLLAANQFDGALDAHSLVRFGAFPDSVRYGVGSAAVSDSVFTYGTGRVTAVIDTTASVPSSPIVLRLYALEQPWDSSSVTWQNASESGGAPVAWRTPGGTLGRLLAETTWVKGDTVALDTVSWQVDSLAMKEIATPGFAGLAITAAQGGARVQLTLPDLLANVHPSSKPDTTLQVVPSAVAQAIVFNPPVPQPAGIFRVGGVTGARTIVRLNLDYQVPSCADPTTGCPMVALKDVTLNRAELLLDAVTVQSGFEPTVPNFLQIRPVLEPELGRHGSLGDLLTQDSIPASLFQAPADQTARVNLTSVFQLYSDSSAVSLALLSVSRTPSFGTLWFTGTPRLRLVYSLPQTPKLP